MASDLPELFEHQNDPVANEVAAFPARALDEFMAHWDKILADASVIARAVLMDDQVAGNLLCFKAGQRRLVGYWIGRQHWGRGIATSALRLFLLQFAERPL